MTHFITPFKTRRNHARIAAIPLAHVDMHSQVLRQLNMLGSEGIGINASYAASG